MSCRTRSFFPIAAIALALLALPAFPAIAAKPLKVYILAGQSNMEGQAKVETFDYIGDDPATAPMLKEMRGPDGKPRVCERVWISYLTGSPDSGTLGEGFGKLTAGYGSRSNPKEDGGKIGPEFTFGITMEKAYDGPILIIKTAWGGKSLNTDFRPPSAGPYELPKQTEELWAKYPQGAHGIPKAEDRPKWHAEKAAKTGVYYRLMIEHVKKVLADPKRVCPDYDAEAGLRDRRLRLVPGLERHVRRSHLSGSAQTGRICRVQRLMAYFIRDVRKDLAAPKMPFVIGVIGVHGDKATGGIANLRPAMAAPAAMPEFKGNVAAVQTAPFWDEGSGGHRSTSMAKVNADALLPADRTQGPRQQRRQDDPGAAAGLCQRVSSQADHRRGQSAMETRRLQPGLPLLRLRQDHGQIGKAFAEAMLEMEES